MSKKIRMQRIAVIIAIVTATVILPVAAQAQTKDDFEYWDLNGNSDLTCTEASGKDEGLKLPAYRDNRDGTGLIYEWLQRQRSSDTDNDGIACDSPSNPNGYVPRAGSTTPPPTNARECPAGSPTWMDLPVCEEGARVSYDRDVFGSAYSSLEDEIIDALPKSDGQVYTPYTCTLFDIQPDGTAATDIEHIVALAEAYDSGLAESQFRTFAGDIDNLTIADPTVNRSQKSDLDAGEWEPPENRGWFAARIVAVKQKYGLSVNPDERDALQAMLNSAPSRTVSCGDGLTSGGPTYYFPHLAVGEGWQTTITYINYSPQEVTCQTEFLSDHGSPLMVSFAALGTVPSRTDVLPPGGSVHQETNVDLNASLALGWARATCSGPVQASLLYRLHNSEGAPTAEAGVNATAVPATRFVTFAEQGEDQFGTGVAYANPSAISVPVTFTARDGVGEVLASVVRTLSPGGHDAHGMSELFDLTSFTGSIEVTSTEPIVSLSINFEAAPVFSSLPPGELDLPVAPPGGINWCTDLQTVWVSFRLKNDKTVSVCRDPSDKLVYSFGTLGREPELEYEGPIVATFSLPAMLWGESIGDLSTLADAVAAGEVGGSDELAREMVTAIESGETNGFYVLNMLTGLISESVYLFRTGGWEYAVVSSVGRPMGGCDGVDRRIDLLSPDQIRYHLREVGSDLDCGAG